MRTRGRRWAGVRRGKSSAVRRAPSVSHITLESHCTVLRAPKLNCNILRLGNFTKISYSLSSNMAIQDTLSGLISVLGISGVLFFLLSSYWIITTYLQYRKLQHIKGPWLASISPLWMFYYSCKGTLYLAVEEALKKHGTTNPTNPRNAVVRSRYSY